MNQLQSNKSTVRWGRIVAPLVVALLMIGVWQLLVWGLAIRPYLLPSPFAVAERAWLQRQELFLATLHTLAAAAGGFAISLILGFTIAVLFSQSGALRAAFYPYAIFFQTVPIVALAPLLMKWVAHEYGRVACVAAVISIFPIITATTTGLLRVSDDLVDLFRLCGASRWQTLWKLRVPAAVPLLITGAKTSCGLAVVGAIVGEFYAGSQTDAFGLGYLIPLTVGQLKTDYLLAAVFCSTAVGVLFFVTVIVLGNTLLARWNPPMRSEHA